MSRLNADIALLMAAAVWGVAFLFQKSAMDHVGPLAFIAASGLVAAAALAPLALREPREVAAPAGVRFPLIAIGGGLAFFIAAWLQRGHGLGRRRSHPDRNPALADRRCAGTPLAPLEAQGGKGRADWAAAVMRRSDPQPEAEPQAVGD